MNQPRPDWHLNRWLVGIANHYYPFPEFRPEPDEYVHVLSRRVSDADPIDEDGRAIEQRPAEMRLAENGDWLNPDRTPWWDGDREVFAWMPRGGDRVAFYRQLFGGSYFDVIQNRVNERASRGL